MEEKYIFLFFPVLVLFFRLKTISLINVLECGMHSQCMAPTPCATHSLPLPQAKPLFPTQTYLSPRTLLTDQLT